MSTLSSVPEEELRNKIDAAIQDHLIIGVDSGQAYFQETDFVIDSIVALINQQIKSVFDELESELDDGKNSHSIKVISSAIQKIRSRYD